jgi:translation initiation factor 1
MSEDICSVCGLPSDLCMCSNLAKEKQVVEIYAIKRRFGKLMTLIEGLDRKAIDIKQLSKQLKSKLACGGTVKGDVIELQGDQRQTAKKLLIETGFAEESIKIR